MAPLPPMLTAAALAGAFAFGGPAAEAAAQDRPAFLMLRGPDREPVEGALGLVLADPPRALPALTELGGVGLFFRHEPDVLGAEPSRRTGTLQLGGGRAGAPRPGAVFVLADAADGGHLTALVERMLPGDADRLQLSRAGLVRAPDDGAELTLYAAALIDGRRVVLPALRGSIVPLPPGRYEAWVEFDGAFTWQRLDVVAGESVTVDVAGEERVLERPRDAVVTPSGRPDVVLLDGERRRCVLRGHAAKAPLTARRAATGEVASGSEPAFADEPEVMELRLRRAAPAAAAGARGFVVSRDPSDRWRVLGAGEAAPGEPLRLPRIRAGDDWLLVVADDHAPFARPLVDVDPEQPLELEAGQRLELRCRLDNGDPARDVLLEYVPRYREVATVAVRTDRRGGADFGNVSLPGTVRASDPRHANVELALDAVPEGGVTLQLGPGFTVRGAVQLPDGEPAAGVTVTLRAPHDALRPRHRAVVTDEAGGFSFGGLAEGHEYVLFATTRRGDRTWSSSMARFTAGEQPLQLTIRNEDPQLGPGR